MNNTFFTADTHFNHKNILEYSDRPFNSIQEHDEALITQWNAVVHPQDSIYHLGDFAFVNNLEKVRDLLRQLNGRKYFIFGSHDKIMFEYQRKYKDSGDIQFLGRLYDLKLNDETIVLCHYAMLRWPRSHYGTWYLFGHSHGSLPDNPHVRAIDVGVDCFNYTPISFDQIKELMDKKLFIPIDKSKRKEEGGIGFDKEEYERFERFNLFKQLRQEFSHAV